MTTYTSCGLAQATCQYCREPLNEGARYCRGCGRKQKQPRQPLSPRAKALLYLAAVAVALVGGAVMSSTITKILLVAGSWAILIGLVCGWGILRKRALLSNTRLGLIVYHALGRGALAVLLALAVIAGWRGGDFVHPFVDVILLLVPLFLIHLATKRFDFRRVGFARLVYPRPKAAASSDAPTGGGADDRISAAPAAAKVEKSSGSEPNL